MIELHKNTIESLFRSGNNNFKCIENTKQPDLLLYHALRSDIESFTDKFANSKSDKKFFFDLLEDAKASGRSYEELFSRTLVLLNPEITLNLKGYYNERPEYLLGRTDFDLDHENIVKDVNHRFKLESSIVDPIYVVVEEYYFTPHQESADIRIKYHLEVDHNSIRMPLKYLHISGILSRQPINFLNNFYLALNKSDEYEWKDIYKDGSVDGGRMVIKQKPKAKDLDTIFDEYYKFRGKRAGMDEFLACICLTDDIEDTNTVEKYYSRYHDGYRRYGIFTEFNNFIIRDSGLQPKASSYQELIERFEKDAAMFEMQRNIFLKARDIISDLVSSDNKKIKPEKPIVYKDLIREFLKDEVSIDPIKYANDREIIFEKNNSNTSQSNVFPYKYMKTIANEMAKSLLMPEETEPKKEV